MLVDPSINEQGADALVPRRAELRERRGAAPPVGRGRRAPGPAEGRQLARGRLGLKLLVLGSVCSPFSSNVLVKKSPKVLSRVD